MNSVPKIAFVLSAGGARGAYQAGVIKAIFEIAPKANITIFTGVSSGAINAAFLAAHADNLTQASKKLATLWSQFRTKNVFRTDIRSIGGIGYHWAKDLLIGGLTHRITQKTLFDTTPLKKYLTSVIPCERIAENITKENLQAIAISATNYSRGWLTTFVQGKQIVCWRSAEHRAIPVIISIDHLMASGAIPIFFPPYKIDEDFYGDGTMRNTTPLSPAIRLGADRLVVIGVRHRVPVLFETANLSPSLARIIGVLLNNIFLDAVDVDLERLTAYNQMLGSICDDQGLTIPMRHVDPLYIRPSEDIGNIAISHQKKLPYIVRYLIAGLGSIEEASELISYLFFEPEYCATLIDLGYKDALKQKEMIEAFCRSSVATDG